MKPSDAMRYDTRRYFNVQSTADMSQIDPQHGNSNYKARKQKKKLKSKKRIS